MDAWPEHRVQRSRERAEWHRGRRARSRAHTGADDRRRARRRPLPARLGRDARAPGRRGGDRARGAPSTSCAFVLPYMTILAVAALGQMLVIMQAGIDLSTAGVISLCGNVLVGVSANSDSRLALGILASVGVGALVGLCNGVLVAIVRLNPLIVTLATGQIALAWSVRYNREVAANPNVPGALSSWAGHKPLGISVVFWTGAALTLLLALAFRYTAAGRRFQAVGANPRAAWMAGLRVRTHVAFAYTAAGALYGAAAVLLGGLRISIDPAFGA